jgi:membrane protein
MIQIIAAIQAIMTKMRQDHIAAFAAQAAFFIIISTFPFIMFILYITRYMPFNQADILMACKEYLPGQYSSLVVSIIEMVYLQQSTALLSFNALSLLWAASKGVNSLINGLNSVYEIDEDRNFIIMRLLSSFYIVLFSVAIIFGLLVLVLGNTFYLYVCRWFPFLEQINVLFTLTRIFVSFTIFILAFLAIYKFLPSQKIRFNEVIPGAIFSAVGWVVSSFVFSLYYGNFNTVFNMYGNLTGLLLALLWLYFAMYIMLIGAEINYHFYHSAQYY